MAALKLSRSFTVGSAALASDDSLASLASKSALFSQIAGSEAVSPPVLELSGHRFLPLSCGRREGRQHLLGLGEIERLLAVDHVAGHFALRAVVLHQLLAGRDRVALRENGGHAERDNRDGKHEAFHH